MGVLAPPVRKKNDRQRTGDEEVNGLASTRSGTVLWRWSRRFLLWPPTLVAELAVLFAIATALGANGPALGRWAGGSPTTTIGVTTAPGPSPTDAPANPVTPVGSSSSAPGASVSQHRAVETELTSTTKPGRGAVDRGSTRTITDFDGHVIGTLQLTELPADVASSPSARETYLYEEWNRVVDTTAASTAAAAAAAARVVAPSASVATGPVPAPVGQAIDVEVWGFSQSRLSGTNVLSATSPNDGLSVYIFIVGNTEVVATPTTPAQSDAVRSFVAQFIAAHA
jgi:hypothetical protein